MGSRSEAGASDAPAQKLQDKPVWYLYMLQCRDGSIYTGITIDPERRIRQHATGKGSKYVASRLPVKRLLLCRQVHGCGSRSEALKTEREVKKMSRDEKISYILHHSSQHQAKLLSELLDQQKYEIIKEGMPNKFTAWIENLIARYTDEEKRKYPNLITNLERFLKEERYAK